MNFSGAEQDTRRVVQALRERNTRIVQPIPRNLLRARRSNTDQSGIVRIVGVKIDAVTADDEQIDTADINGKVKNATRANQGIVVKQYTVEDK
jgi:hypothetical protein